MMPEHPLRGKNDERFGPRFLNMSEPFSIKMIAKAKELGQKFNIKVQDGIYLGLQGPTFETLAEYKMVKIVGADCVGMSTVPEVIVARHMDMEVFGLSVITDMGNEGNIETVSHEEVLEAARKAEPKVRILIKELILQY
jgi:purine-nucleoside phosphorylase